MKQEVLLDDLILLERVPNEKVRELMKTVDILKEQFIFTDYSLRSIKGMQSGLSALYNLDQEAFTRIFRRYAFINECAIKFSIIKSFAENLQPLIKNLALRNELGHTGRKYVEKCHSSETMQYLFGVIYGKSVDLINSFHLLKSAYNNRKPYIQPLLVENELTGDYQLRC